MVEHMLHQRVEGLQPAQVAHKEEEAHKGEEQGVVHPGQHLAVQEGGEEEGAGAGEPHRNEVAHRPQAQNEERAVAPQQRLPPLGAVPLQAGNLSQGLGGADGQPQPQQQGGGQGEGQNELEEVRRAQAVVGVEVQVLGVADGGGHAAQVGGDGLHGHHGDDPVPPVHQLQHLQGEGDEGDEGHVVGHRHAGEKGQEEEHPLQLPGGGGAGEHQPPQPAEHPQPPQAGHHGHQGEEEGQGMEIYVGEVAAVRVDQNYGHKGQGPGHHQHGLPLHEAENG